MTVLPVPSRHLQAGSLQAPEQLGSGTNRHVIASALSLVLDEMACPRYCYARLMSGPAITNQMQASFCPKRSLGGTLFSEALSRFSIDWLSWLFLKIIDTALCKPHAVLPEQDL